MFKKPRINAFLIHITISFAVLLVPAYLIVFHWYPFPYFHTDGGWQGIRILAGVSLVLGPLLTLIVYKQGKPGLKFDLTMIGLAQAVALIWGIWITYTERPVAVVYTMNYFTSVPAKSLTKLGFNHRRLAMYGHETPVPIFLDLPKDIDNKQKYLAQAIGSGIPLYLFTDLYKNIDTESLKIIKQNSDELYKYLESDENGRQLLDTFFQTQPELYDHYLFIPLHSRYKWLVIVLDATNLSYTGTLDISATEFLLGLTKGEKQEPSMAQDN